MKERSTVVGMDVHKRDIVVCALRGEERQEWRFPNEPRAIARWCRKMQRESEHVRVAYEAGPCGYVLKRQLEAAGIECDVVAPSLIPGRPGDRVKTDRRDASKLADYLRSGHLTPVHAPSCEEESVRDLCRCRDQAKRDLTRARHRLGKFLLRRGLRYGKGRAWTHAHRKWLWSVELEQQAAQWTFEYYLLAVEQLETRLREIDASIEEVSQSDRYRGVVGALRCFRGIDTHTAMTIVSELHDVRRFRKPRQLMSYLGLTPSERSSGESTRRGGITKTGNAHVRRVLVEAAWHSRHRPAVGVNLRKRRTGQPAAATALADRAMHRLHRRYWRLVQRGKAPQTAVTAVARELTGFVWSALHLSLDSDA